MFSKIKEINYKNIFHYNSKNYKNINNIHILKKLLTQNSTLRQ